MRNQLRNGIFGSFYLKIESVPLGKNFKKAIIEELIRFKERWLFTGVAEQPGSLGFRNNVAGWVANLGVNNNGGLIGVIFR